MVYCFYVSMSFSPLALYCCTLFHHMFFSLQQDSLLASPIILDLVILTELCQRVTVRPQGEEDFQSFHSVLALLSFLCKAPLVPPGTPVINAFFRQRASIENIMRYPPVSKQSLGFLFFVFLHIVPKSLVLHLTKE